MSQEPAFSYTYSAPTQQEVQRIRNQYLPQTESKLEELQRLDHQVQTSGVPQALCIGICGCLIFGLGLSIGLGAVEGANWICVLLSILGAVGMFFAYPVYKRIFRKTKEEFTPRILELSAELCGTTNHKER